MAAHYGLAGSPPLHVRRADPTDHLLVVIAIGCGVIAVVEGMGVRVVVVLGVVSTLAMIARRTGVPPLRWLALGVSLLVVVGVHARHQDAHALPDVGPYSGWVTVVDDPQPFGSSARAVLSIEGRRYEMWARGNAARRRVTQWDAGDMVMVAGLRVALSDDRRDRVAWQHVVGAFESDWLGDRRVGSPVARASNRVRGLVGAASTAFAAPDNTLFTGLVIGDDRDQPPEMLNRFRRTGLSHLTAVSGQNVALVLAAASPILRCVSGRLRTAMTLGLILWFVVITRLEPSILRAGVMAALAVIARAGGRETAPMRMLALAVCVLLVIDPVLASSVGFQLSVGATAGVIAIGPRLTRSLRRLGVFAAPLGITLGAQLGVLLPSALVFGRLPVTGVGANLLAVPVAGLVMFLGLPLSILAGVAEPLRPLLMFPMRIGVRWVDTVALLADRVEPRDPAFGWWVHGAVVVVALVCAWGRRLRR